MIVMVKSFAIRQRYYIASCKRIVVAERFAIGGYKVEFIVAVRIKARKADIATIALYLLPMSIVPIFDCIIRIVGGICPSDFKVGRVAL